MSCGDCSMCCKLVGVSELDKPMNKWCEHTKPGRGGCAIYANRPHSCAAYLCGWAATQQSISPMPPELRPDRCKVILDPVEGRLVVRVDPGRPQAWEDPAIISRINAYIESGREVLIITGDRRKLLAN